MKTMKHSGKKILSVFLAVLMVMTAWVFVAPEKASATAAATVAGDNTVALNSIPSFNTNVTTIHGSFESDSDYLDTQYYDAIYKNVLYTDGPVSIAASATSSKTEYGSSWTGSNGVTLYWYHATATVMYDGETIPSLGVCVNPVMYYTGTWSRKSVNRLSWIESGGNGFTINENWHGSDGRLNFNYMWHGQSAMMGYDKNDTGNTSMFQTLKGNSDNHFYANLLKFTGSMSDTEFSRSAQPYFGFYGDNGDDGKKIYAQSGDTLYVINYKPLKAALNEALGTGTYSISTLKNNTAKYTTASIAEYVAAVKDLIAAKPNNYVNSSKNDYVGYANAASAAVTRFNNAKANLEVQKYTLKFTNIDGVVKHTQTLPYGTAVNCTDIAADLGNTIKQYNDQYHQTHIWDNSNYVSTITDDVEIVEKPNNTVAHDYGSYTQDDTTHSRTCSVCGYVQTQDHTRGTGYVTKTETCTEDGVMTYDCSVCGKTAIETSIINNITGHSFTGDAVENVAGQNGNHWKKCSRCDVYGLGTTANAFEKHNWDKNADGTVDASDAVTKASTCKEAGYEKYTCKVCSATWTKTLDLAAHNTTATAAKDVTNECGSEGNIAYWTCSVCNKVWKDAALTEEISNVDADNDGIPDAAETKGPDHEFTSTSYKSVTPGKDGTHNRACRICGKAYGIGSTEGATEPHVWGAPTVVDATCTKEGSKTYKCTLCPQTYTEAISKVAHEMTKIDAVEPKCGIAGNNEYYQCTVCNDYFKDATGTTKTTVSAETIPALVHTWTSHHDYDELKEAATCQNAAVYNNHCDYCEIQLIGATHTYGDPDTVNGHQFNGAIKQNADGTHSYACTVSGCTEYGSATTCNYEVTEDVASTCKTPGYTTHTCTVCKNGYSITKALDPNNHKGEGTYIIASSEPTCATLGSTGIEKCSGCNETLSSKINDIPVDLTKHENMQNYEKLDSTCQTEGYKAYKYCSACGTYEIAKETIAKKEHKFTTYTPNGDGTHTATCDTCDPTVATPATDTKDCSGGTANCVDKAVCTVCSGEYGNVDSANHKTIITVKKKDSTCQTEGYEAYRKCEACDVDIDTITPIAKKDHVYGSWSANNDGTHSRSCTTCDATVEEVAKETADCSGGVATCIAKAKCSVCKAEYGEINSANHATQAATLKNAKEASCTEEGYTGDRHYDCCDAIKEKGTAIPMLDHKYTVALEDTKVASTCTEKGSIDYQCETCDATEKRELELNPQNHSSEEIIVVNDKAPTCESDGYTGDTYHKCCYKAGGTTAENRYALISKGSVIKANGQHVYSDAVPEYMIDEIVEEKDAEGNVTSRSIKLKTEEPDYAEKITYRRADNYWYHKQICTICYEVVETRCYTYPDHQADCVNTDICFVCEGLCSLTNPDKHTLKEIEKISATCEKDGRKAYYVCEACDKEFFDLAGKNEITDENKSQLVIPSTKKHTIDRDETPKADNKGNHTYSCSVCGTAIVEACSGGEATCKDKAKCEYCGVGYGELNKNKHVKGTIIQGKVDPDRCKPGVSGKTVYECCPDVVVYEGDITPATEPHDWKETTDKADNCANGYTITKTCNYCGEVETTEVAAGTHDLSVVVYETEKDCKKERTIYYACSICGFTDKEVEIDGVTYKYIFAEVIEAKEDCTWTSWTYEQKPSCVVEGKKTRKCVACGKTEEEILPKTDHTIKTEAGYAATCDKAGKQDYVYCVIEGCPYAKGGAPIGQLAGYEKYKDCNGKVIEALGHGDHNGDDYCDHCGGFLQENEDGTNCNCICHKRHWFMRIIYKILSFFWKLFGISRTCCSAGVHY